MEKLNVGDNVYVWDGRCMPKKAIITEVNVFDIGGIRCKTDDKVANNRVYSKHSVYKNIDNLKDDIYTTCKDLEIFCGNI